MDPMVKLPWRSPFRGAPGSEHAATEGINKQHINRNEAKTAEVNHGITIEAADPRQDHTHNLCKFCLRPSISTWDVCNT